MCRMIDYCLETFSRLGQSVRDKSTRKNKTGDCDRVLWRVVTEFAVH